MNTHLRRRLLADAAVNSHAHPARVDRAVSYGIGRYRRHVTYTYAAVITASVVVFGALLAGHPAARAVLNSLADGSTATTSSPSASAGPSVTPDSDVVLTSISIVPGAVTLAAGATAQLTVVGNFSDGSSGPVAGTPAWQSGNEAIALVSDAGVVTALVPVQSTEITASLAGFTDTMTVSIEARVLSRISIRSVSSSSDTFQKDLEPDGQAGLTVGGDAQLVADVAYSDGTSGTLADVAWATDREAVATVDSAGRLHAVAEGTARITATVQGVVGTISIVVVDDAVVG